jgi:DNA-binding transcriptional ArsR family regulator
MERETRGTLVQFFKTLANESRLKILGILARQESSVGELAAYLDLREPTISHHLAKLKDMDLVDMHPEGTTHLYRLNSEALQAMSKEIFTPERIASLADEMGGEKRVYHKRAHGAKKRRVLASVARIRKSQ